MNRSAEIAIPDAEALMHEVETTFSDAVELEGRLHLAGVRDRYREMLERVIALADRTLAGEVDGEALKKIQTMLLRVHAARAEDARYGAGQLSRGSQRAPTREDCDDGWLRVEEIVGNAEASAKKAEQLAEALGKSANKRYAQAAQTSARSARQILDERNLAYTFHSDPGFSFGEGWYLAASALLAGVPIQIKPGAALAQQTERFLQDAGLGASLRPYRSRPRSNKQLTAIVADAFREDPATAQKKVRAAFLGDAPPSSALFDWIHRRVGGISSKKVLLWVRNCTHDAMRNTAFDELEQLSNLVHRAGFSPIFFGDAIPKGIAKDGSVDLTLTWKEPRFQGAGMRRAQLQLFETLKCRHGLVGQLGVTTAGMDGPALIGLPTLYITDAPNVRMGRWVGVIPRYQEVVRKAGYLNVIRNILQEWNATKPQCRNEK